jgi:hypothetical protein
MQYSPEPQRMYGYVDGDGNVFGVDEDGMVWKYEE